MAELVAKTYAQALYDVGLEGKSIDKFLEELNFIRKSFDENEDLFRLYKTPKINKEEKKVITDNIFKGNVSEEIVNFIKVLLDKRRINKFYDIVKAYEKMANEYYGIVDGLVDSAIKLDNDTLKKLEEKLSIVTNKKVKLENNVDPSIMGGIRVRVGDKVFDDTIKNRLDNLAEELAQIIV
ncbi:MAG: F0F1 ATP synthase subunit delta [Anaeromicrobium sp.]|jgi:F-type H+-transporting ATPase subunit delta|uniref:F0F1 ATP synthase subunit delta n=1 Tax=Anaeromicrobium sp. TaxID=1929132 RepID=UPI0025F456DF|nr:F0F1 ATP synthase subunit delta [Anaeromicrobium sp.]MCT4592772.1 F0F1 ATP synthase subunit delta [Anaeromicrobium sp.]